MPYVVITRVVPLDKIGYYPDDDDVALVPPGIVAGTSTAVPNTTSAINLVKEAVVNSNNDGSEPNTVEAYVNDVRCFLEDYCLLQRR